MLDYTIKSSKIYQGANSELHSFLSQTDKNIDWDTIEAFGKEWGKFKSFDSSDLQKIGDDYFDLVDSIIINKKTIALDVGCGSGRWARYLADQVGFIEAIDPSEAVFTASAYLADKKNVRVTQAGVDSIPFADQSFDFVYSLGVLHHLPDTQQALNSCVRKLKSGGWILLYLYYNLDNRGLLYKWIFQLSAIGRFMISRMPGTLKRFVCDLIATFVYLPFVLLSKIIRIFSAKLAAKVPLAYYQKTSFSIMRNDALDRFGTPLEKRFSKQEIFDMLDTEGLHNIQFSDQKPYWHVIAQKP